MGDGYDSASDSDEELDEADEDSNGMANFCVQYLVLTPYTAEEYYKNDYPDEDDGSGMYSMPLSKHFPDSSPQTNSTNSRTTWQALLTATRETISFDDHSFD